MDLQKLNDLIADANLALKNKYIENELLEFAKGVENLIYNNAILGNRCGDITIRIPVQYRTIENLATFIVDYLSKYCRNICFVYKEIQLSEGLPSAIKIEYRIPKMEEVK